MSTEEHDTKSIAGMFAEAQGCLEDAAHLLGQINEEFDKRYPDDMDPNDPAAPFWYTVAEVSQRGGFNCGPLEGVQEQLEAVEKYVPKEVTQ